jgi:outer membrane protein TolC
MKKTLIYLSIIIPLWLVHHAASAQQTFTLDEAVAHAMDNNLEITNARLAIEDAEQQIVERRSIGLPQVNGSLEYNYYPQVPVNALPAEFAAAFGLPPGEPVEVAFLLRNNFTAGLTANSLLFDGTYFTGLKAARLLRDYTQMELNATEEKVRNSVMDAYLPSLLITESMKTLDKNIKNLEQVLFETREIYKAGFAEQLDVDRLVLSLANLKTERSNLEQQKKITLDALKFTMNFPLDKDIAINDDINSLLSEASAEELTGEINYLNRSEFKVAEVGLKLGELNIEQFERGFWPSVAAFAGYNYQYQGNNFNDGFWAPTFVLGAQVNVPIFDGFSTRAKKERAKIDLMKNQNSKNMLSNVIRLEVENARNGYLLAKDRLSSQEENLKLAERIYNTTKIKYKEGVGSSLEVSQAEQSLYQTQQNKIQAQFDLLKAKVALEQALGDIKN